VAAVLQRIQAFLPQMEAANADLLQRAQNRPESVNIEQHDEEDAGDGQYIEMNLGLGVFDIRAPSSERSSSDKDCDSDVPSDISGDSSDSSDEDTGESSESDSVVGGRPAAADGRLIRAIRTQLPSQRPMRPLPKRAKPSIVVLGETSSEPK